MARGAGATGSGGVSGGGGGGGGFLLLLLLLLFFPGWLSLGVPTNDVQPTCYTDYAAELACCWEAALSANCTEAFQLRYQTDASGELQECLPKNVRGPGPGSWCTCVFPVASPFRIVLDRITTRNRTEVWQTKVENKGEAPSGHPEVSLHSKEALKEGEPPTQLGFPVKPLPLVNLTVAKKSHSFLLTWKKDYVADSIIHKTKANYEVAYWLQGQEEKLAKCPGNDGVCCFHWCQTLDTEPPCLAVRQASTEVSSGYEIYANQLVPHSNYMASVRYRLVLWETVWSEWSSPCTWYNDLELGDKHGNDLLWVCVPVVAVILTCYICLGRVKKWQDSIPHPVILVGKQIPNPSFPKKERKPSPYGIKALLCDLCNRNGREFQGRRPPAPASGHTTMQENEPPAQQELVLWPEIPLIEHLPVRCSCETGTEPQTQQEKMEEHRHVPHANAMASLFRDAVTGDLSPADTRGLELWPEGQEGPSCPRQPPPENVCQAPHLLPEWSLDVHGDPGGKAGDPGGRATVEGSSEPGYQKTIMEEPVAAAGPAPKQGLSCDPAASEKVFQSLLLPPESPSTRGGAAHLKSTDPCPDGQAGGLHPAAAHGYKSFSSLSQHTANFHEALQGQPSLPVGDRIQLLGSDRGGGGSSQSLLLSPRVCGLNSLFPGGRDSLPWLSSGKGAAATPLILTPPKEDSSQHIRVGAGTTPCPEALSPAGYRSLASLLQNGAGGMYPSSLGLESPGYKPLLSVLRSGPTEPPPALLLGPGPREKASGIAAWPGVLWDATLGLSQQSDSMEEEDRGLPCI